MKISKSGKYGSPVASPFFFYERKNFKKWLKVNKILNLKILLTAKASTTIFI